MPAIIGFFVTGVVVGPHGLSLIEATKEVNEMAEIGLIFLLFIIGIEFSMKGLISIGSTVLFGGLLQVGGTAAVVTGVATLMGLPLTEAIFMGATLSLSSTAIVLKALQERGELNAPHGRLSVGLLIFQDLAVVLMILLTPLMAAGDGLDPITLLKMVLAVLALVVVVFLAGRYVVPTLLAHVVRTQSRELFLLTVIVICFATAWASAEAGLSLALGAFFAGLVISESEYSHYATASIIPFREIFITFLFVSVGMLLDISFFFSHFFYIILFAIGVALLKFIIVALTARILRYPTKVVWQSAFSLFQVGEFAFVLSAKGLEEGVLSEPVYQYFLAISLITMGGTPFIIHYTRELTEFMMRVPLIGNPTEVTKEATKIREANEETLLRDHLVIIGYGVNGQNLGKAAREAKIPHVIVEADPDQYKKAQANHQEVVFGDATNEVTLLHVNIQLARIAVVAISDAEATKRIISAIRGFSDTIHLIVRTRYITEVEENLRAGANDVIPEEFETSIEIFTRVLNRFLIPTETIQSFISRIRSANYNLFRSEKEEQASLPINVPDLTFTGITVEQGNNSIVGKTIVDAGLKERFGLTVLAIKRNNEHITNIGPDNKILPDDVLYLAGSPDKIAELNQYLKF